MFECHHICDDLLHLTRNQIQLLLLTTISRKSVSQNASELGIDPEKIIASDSSSGGGIAAGVALLALETERAANLRL